MGERIIVFGCIVEPHVNDPQARARLEHHNRANLFDLPDEDTWPPLHRSLFASSPSDAFKGGYRGRVIHYGASLKNLLEDWERWVGKLEGLLRELIWIEAWLKTSAGAYGQREHFYTASDEIVESFARNQPQQTRRWSVEKRFV